MNRRVAVTGCDPQTAADAIPQCSGTIEEVQLTVVQVVAPVLSMVARPVARVPAALLVYPLIDGIGA
jgi:hypothetical protein